MKNVLMVSLLVLVASFLGYVSTRPDSYRVERAIAITAPAELIFDQLDDFRSWAAWSPWEKLDPTMKKAIEGPESGVGAAYSWEGNKDVGKGKMTVTTVTPARSITYTVEFKEPFAGTAEARFDLAAQGTATQVTWSMSGRNDFMGKLFGLFMDMDAIIGADLEKGLSTLKSVSETVVADKGEIHYYLADNEISKEGHGAVCTGSKPAVVIGTVSEVERRKVLTATSITYQ